MVCDTDTAKFGTASTNALARLVFPAPEGADKMNNVPCFIKPVASNNCKVVRETQYVGLHLLLDTLHLLLAVRLFNVLHLFAHLLNEHFELDGPVSNTDIG